MTDQLKLRKIDREASEWLARRRLARPSASDEAAFEAWLGVDVRHGAAFEGMTRTFEDVVSLSALAELEPLDPAPRRARFPATVAPRRRVMAGLSAAAAVVLAMVITPGLLDQPDIQAATRIAEVREVVLPDGTRVTLGAKSKIKVRFDNELRRVELTDGEAFFEIAPDASRPFEVDTGGTVIRDIGTKFDVKRAAGRIEVSVLEGAVEVTERTLLPGKPTARLLRAGQRVSAAQTELGALTAPIARVGVVEASTAVAGAWRDGQLTYDDTRLADVVADLNRYYAPGVRLQSGALGDARLAASFKAHEIDKFLQELPKAAPVVVTRNADGAVTISPA